MSRVRKFRPVSRTEPDPDPPDSGDTEPEVVRDGRGGTPSPTSRTLRELGRRIEEILEIAERTAAEIENEAADAARSYADERRREADREFERRRHAADREAEGRVLAASRLEALLRRKAQEVLTQAQGLAGAAEAVLAALPATGEGQPGGVGEPEAEVSNAPAPSAAPARDDAPEEALLRAAHLAVAGSSRADIERTLRAEFGIDSPAELVDEILGGGDPG